MSKSRVIDEVHLTLRVPTDLPDDEAEAVRDALAVVRAFPELNAIRVSVTR